MFYSPIAPQIGDGLDREPFAAMEQLLNKLGSASSPLALTHTLFGRALRGSFSPELTASRTRWASTFSGIYAQEQLSESLFVRHVYLAAIARAVAWIALERAVSSDRRSTPQLDAIFGGEAHVELGAANLSGFPEFDWPRDVADALDDPRPEIFAVLEALDTEELIDGLGPLYQELVAPGQRHQTGEYYTPRWLAAEVVATAIAALPRASVLDPACGAGVFLRAALLHGANAASGPEVERVVGYDIHPLAVLTARAVYAATAATQLVGGTTPVEIPVFLGDALAHDAGVGRFDVVVGNPPWVAFRFLPGPRRAQATEIAQRYGLGARGRLKTHLELAAVFLLHAGESWLRPDGRVAMILPRSVMGGAQYAQLRRGPKASKLRVQRLWDLRGVEKLFPVPACVVFAAHTDPTPTRLPGQMVTRNKGGTIRREPVTWELRRLADLCAWAPWDGALPGAFAVAEPSCYRAEFRQGATLVPRSYWFVEISGRDSSVHARTDPSIARFGKPPYRDEVFEGPVERAFVRQAVLARHLLPWVLLEPAHVVLPVDPQTGQMLDADQLEALGYPQAAGWLRRAQRAWSRNRGDKTSAASVLDRLDYHGELSAQALGHRQLVAYNASGTHLAAVAVGASDPGFVFDAKCYWWGTDDPHEANFVAGVLNTPLVDRLVKPFQSVGQQGERDLHKKVLALPIPRFDPASGLHREVAHLASVAADLAHDFVSSRGPAPQTASGLGRLRSAVREHVLPTTDKLDAAVGRIFSLPGAP